MMYGFGRNGEALRRHEYSLTLNYYHLLLDLYWIGQRVFDGE